MKISNPTGTTRRRFLQTTGALAGVSALAGVPIPRVHAAENNLIQVALIGCGGRGTGAAADALSVRAGPLKLVAMADVFKDRLDGSYPHLKERFGDRVDVPKERQFIGFDAYKKAMDCLRPGDIAIFTSPPAFRWVHFAYAIEKGLHVFMEKPVTVDGPTTKKFLELAKKSVEKNLKVGVGLMSRHSRHLQELAKRIADGELGDIIFMRGYRVHGPIGFFASTPKPPGQNELLYQVRRFHSFLWASGGCFSDFYIHIIDHCCWMKGDQWPLRAQAVGGRHYKNAPDGTPYVDQNFDVYSVEYEFPDGSTFIMDGRCIAGCADRYYSYAKGTKAMAIISAHGDCGSPSRIYKGFAPKPENQIWQSKAPPGEENPYQNEWNDLVDAIRQDKPYNEAERGAMASLVTSMGRMAAHTGQVITLEQMLNCPHEFAPDVDKLTEDSPAPLQADKDGRYPVPQPGILKDREY
ncbi:MAG: Gfo/Idh/MocA family oxidoreductase [Thermoguttaceae bacterium]|nr:Gfo/Idh/MocA family oxidoreductase [Thermoguttaceae bacterium]MDW8036912.1 Gfo/Idh/MocA family oxidoreductase [Thermoguttaceae bacterium]